MRLSRHARIVAEAVEVAVDTDDARVTVRTKSHPALEVLRHPIDCTLAIVVTLVRLLTGRPIAPLEVRVPYSHPAGVSDYRRMFRAPVLFGGREAMVVFRRRDLDVLTPMRDETLTGYLEEFAKRVSNSIETGKSFLDRVRWAIWADLGSGQATSRRTADRLGLSAVTLGRRLRKEGTKYSTVLDALRHRLAVDFLRNTRLGSADIAFLLGYSSGPNFRRAFRRWEGVSPGHLRQRRRSPTGPPSSTYPTTN
jgi:AraC-like DNA-binding protein